MTNLAPVTRSKARADQARVAFDDAVRTAHAEGASTRAIAEACGLSHQRVWQIIQRR